MVTRLALGGDLDRRALVEQLRLERGNPDPKTSAPSQPSRGRGLLAGVAGCALFIMGFAVSHAIEARLDAGPRAPPATGAAAGASQNLTLPPSTSARPNSVLEASGYVVARREATVASKVIGKVLEVRVEEGQSVRAGEILAVLDASTAEAQLREALARHDTALALLTRAQIALDTAAPRYRRSEALHVQGYLSAQALENVREEFLQASQDVEVARRQASTAAAQVDVARNQLSDNVVRAPFAGVVTVKAAQPGEIVSPTSAGGFTRTGICTIVDMTSLEVEVDIGEKLIDRVRKGMPVVVRLNAYPDWAIPGEVLAVIPTAERSKASVAVRIGLKVADQRVIPEMGAQVAFLDQTVAPATLRAPASNSGGAKPTAPVGAGPIASWAKRKTSSPRPS